VERVEAAINELLRPPEPAPDSGAPGAPARKKPWWRGWSSSTPAGDAALRQQITTLEAQLGGQREAAGRVQQFLHSLLTGYKMGLQRVERALEQHDLEIIDCVGRPF